MPAEKALVKTAALIICGRTLIPARLIAMTYGLGEGGKAQDGVGKTGSFHLWAAFPVARNKSGSVYGTSIPVIRTPRICEKDNVSGEPTDTLIGWERT